MINNNLVLAEKGEVFKSQGNIRKVPKSAPSHDDSEKGVFINADEVLSASYDQVESGDRNFNLPEKIVRISKKEGNEYLKSLGYTADMKKSMSPSRFYEHALSARDKHIGKITKKLDSNPQSRCALNSMTANLDLVESQPTDDDLFDFVFDIQESKKDTSPVDFDSMQEVKYGGIHIKPENRGKFTAKAKRAGKGVQEYARQVLANKKNYPTNTVKQAVFARNFARKKQYGGSTYIQKPQTLPNSTLVNKPDNLGYFKYVQSTEPYLGEKLNSSKYSYINNIPTIVKRAIEKVTIGDDVRPFVKKLNNKKIGVYNQGRPGEKVESSIIASFYNPFVSKLDANKEYFGVTKEGKFIIDKGNNTDIVKGSELNNSFDLGIIDKVNEKKFIFRDKNGNEIKRNGHSFIVKNQDNGDIFLYRDNKSKTLPILKSYIEKNKNVKWYQIDNGSYEKGLFTEGNRPPTVEELDAYDRYNPKGGGYGIFEKHQFGGESTNPLLKYL